MDNNLINDESRRWQNMSIQYQIGNIGGEVIRAIKRKKRGNLDHAFSYYTKALKFLELTINDPKNKKRKNELELCKEELNIYFETGESTYNFEVSDESLENYYNQFINH